MCRFTCLLEILGGGYATGSHGTEGEAGVLPPIAGKAGHEGLPGGHFQHGHASELSQQCWLTTTIELHAWARFLFQMLLLLLSLPGLSALSREV